MSDTWDLTPDRYLPLMSADNQEFMVFGVLGLPGAGKSTILNEIYGFDSSAQGVLPPFNTQTEEVRAMARHCSVGLELRMCAERIILLDTQPVFSASVLVNLMRPDGTSNTPVMGGETMSAELAHEIMGLQIEMLKQGIPDPSVVAQGPSATDTSGDKDRNDNDEQIENFADAVFVYTNKRRRVVLLAPGSFNPPTYMHLRMFVVESNFRFGFAKLGMDALTAEGYHVLGGYMSGCLVVLLSTSAWDCPAPGSVSYHHCRQRPTCLVPGTRLGRLACEISRLGFIAQGNEFSYYMLICSNFILNQSYQPLEWALHPWIHSNYNSLSDSNQLRADPRSSSGKVSITRLTSGPTIINQPY